MNAADQRRLTPLLVVLTTALAAGVLVLLSGVGSGAQWGPPRPVAALPAPTSPVNLPRPIPLQQFSLVWTKPLFSPNRKPVARVADGGSTLGDLTLTGVLLTPELHMALLRDRNGDKELRLREGQALPDGSVTLVEVRPRSALFDSAAGRTELKLASGAPIDVASPNSAAGGVGVTTPDAARSLDAVPAKPGAAPAPGVAPEPVSDKPTVVFPTPTRPTTDGPPPRSAMTRMREEVKKHRAAQGAADNEGVR
jgi:general secretion pathway protein N